MMSRFLNFQRTLAVCAFAICAATLLSSAIEPAEDLEALRQLESLVETGAVSDDVYVEEMGRRFDALRGRTDGISIGKKVDLVWRLAFVSYSIDKTALELAKSKRRAALAKVISGSFPAELDGRSLMYFSAGMMGVPVDQERLLRFAQDMSQPNGLRLFALEAVLQQDHIWPKAESYLSALSKDEWHHRYDSDVGPLANTQVFPLRDKAANILKKLKAEEIDGLSRKQSPMLVISGKEKPIMDAASGRVRTPSNSKTTGDSKALVPSDTMPWVAITLWFVALLGFVVWWRKRCA